MNNKPHQHLINLITLQLVRGTFKPYSWISKKQNPPLLVSGAFRSGTSVTTLILANAGFSIGLDHHLIKAKGKFYPFNPDGYMEDFFFMELSMYLFKLSNAAGDRPPKEALIDKIEIESLSDDEIRKHSLLNTHDDRVNNFNKMRIFRKASVKGIQQYIQNVFGSYPLIKNPHFSVLEPFFSKLFPNSKRVVVFRHPADWLTSVKILTQDANYNLYNAYYAYYLKHNNRQFIFFNYDKLLTDTENSIRDLLAALNMPLTNIDTLANLVRNKKNMHEVYKLDADLPEAYGQLLKKAVNQ